MSGGWRQALEARLEEWRGGGLRRQLRTASGGGVRPCLDGLAYLSFASNDYLGLGADPRLADAAAEAMRQDGSGSAASPLITGHRSVHAELEAELAAFKRTSSALVLPSGYQASLTAIAALAGAEDSILLDRLAHACLLDGAKLSGARVRVFKHNDAADLRALLEKERPRRCLIAVESLYSMDGDTAPLAELSRLAVSSGALLLVDEAHATGVLGASGRGALEELCGASGLPEHIIALGTLSKALGAQGGYVCAPAWVTDTILHAGRAYMFSTALSPAPAGAAREALRIIATEPARRKHLLKLAVKLRGQLAKLGLETIHGEGPIIPILAGGEERALDWSRRLLDEGLLVPAIRYPTVKKGSARLRISLSAAHTDGDVEQLAAALAKLRERHS